MEQEARRILVWMPDMTNENDVRIFIGKIKAFQSRFGITDAELARRIGVSSTTISQALNNKYPGKIEDVFKKITEYMNRIGRRNRREKGDGYVETTVAKAILSAVRLTEQFTEPQEGSICLVIGDAGQGKTVCLQQYALTNPHSIYVKLRDKMTPLALIAAINKELKLASDVGLKKLSDELAAHLAKREMTVLLDEASGLDVGKLNLLRQLVVENGCTLILAGNAGLLRTVQQSTARHGNESLDQFKSRMLGVLNLDELAGQPLKDGGFYSIEDIRRLYQYGGIRLTSDAENLLRRIAKTPQTGRLRTCSKIISAIHNTKKAQAGQIKEIHAEDIVGMIKQLGLCVENDLPMIIGRAEEPPEQAEAKTA